MNPIAARVARRFAFKYEPKEKKVHKVDRIWRAIRDQTGVSRALAESIADALVRGRNLEALAYQKSWPVEEGVLIGPSGKIDLNQISV